MQSTLDPEETSVTPPPAAPGSSEAVDVVFRHSGWLSDRRRIQTALSELATPLRDKDDRLHVAERRRLAFDQCGADAYLQKAEYGPRGGVANLTKYRVRATHCHDRFCVPCSRERANIIRCSLLQHMHGRKNLSLITLTLNGTGQDLDTLTDRCYRHFKALRQLPLWKDNVKGGAAILETKVGQDGERWHCHWHILCEAGYLDQRRLSVAWHTLTEDSFIVDIRRVGALGGAVQYITKYVTKAADTNVVRSPRHLKEAILAFAGRRLVTTFGTWRGLVLLPEVPHDQGWTEDEKRWTTIGRLDEVIRNAAAGDTAARAIIAAINANRRPAVPSG